jgi:RimJ/RimL family protein N-acetyltransferase
VTAVPAITSARLELVSMSPAFLEALLDGRREDAGAHIGVDLPPEWPDEHDRGFLALRLGQMRRDPAVQEWLVRAVALRNPARAMIGHAGFHGPPGVNERRRADGVELGYTIFPEYRRRGYATETVTALMAWAERAHGVRYFVASVSPDNAPSLAVVRKLGFEHVGEHWDEEDGLEWEFALERPQTATIPVT